MASAMETNSHPSQGNRRSASRVTNACRICKQRRSKCDGLRPRCTACQQNSRECNYEGVDLRKARHTAVEFKALNNRIAYLEQQVKDLENQSGQAVETSPRVEPDPDHISDTHLVGPTKNDTIKLPEILGMSAWDALDATDEWMDENPLLTSWDQAQISLVRDYLATKLPQLQVEKNGKTFYVGPTSNLHLLSRGKTDSQSISSISTPGGSALQRTSLRAHEERLFETFRTKVHPSFPILGDEYVLEGSQVISQAISHPLLFYSILGTASFVAGDDFSTPWGHSRTDALEFYTAKFTAISGKELENCSFNNVKAFILRAYLEALRGRLESATIFNSIACAMAKRLGLHVDCTATEAEASISSSGEQRERLAVFWATLWLDRRIAILEGRACHIDHIDISSPRPLQLIEAKEGYSDLPLSLELVYACHLEFSYLQDLTLIKL
ncbi:hypothetical protein QQX98_006278 [Neonectria punicea]|uniref:Zn(2)-C6 fungal-type domain-containing protein n=1 Tax=Neonectria punicea TaxID=979145 RepID=A0ABR1H1H6_9HYPO